MVLAKPLGLNPRALADLIASMDPASIGHTPPGDLAGFAVGAVEKSAVITGRDIVPGDVVLGLASSGAHSNGYSLVRKIIARAQPDLNAPFDGDKSLADAIMAPTRIYVKPMLALMAALPVKGMAHITGGGLTENVPRVLHAGSPHPRSASVTPDQYILDNKVRYWGETVAVVAATSEEVAEAALDLIEVEYEPLPAVFTTEDAAREGAPLIHEREPGGNLVLPPVKVSRSPSML